MNKRIINICLRYLVDRERQLIGLISLKSLRAKRGDMQEQRLKERYESELEDIRFAIRRLNNIQ